MLNLSQTTYALPPRLDMPGTKPQNKVKLEWSSDFAYAVGLVASDGCLYKNEPIINFTSKDVEQIKNFQQALGIQSHVGRKASGSNSHKDYFVIQISDKTFHEFLVKIGITPAKSKTMGALEIPGEYFFDFLRGTFDGDGCTYSYWDKRWKSSFMFYTTFVSASKVHIDWLRESIFERIGVKGHISKVESNSCYQLRYAKSESIILLDKMYYSPAVVSLSRKRLKIEQMLAIVGGRLDPTSSVK